MGGWASFWIFSVGRVGGRPVFVVKNRVGVGGRPGTPGPVGGPDHPTPCARAVRKFNQSRVIVNGVMAARCTEQGRREVEINKINTIMSVPMHVLSSLSR